MRCSRGDEVHERQEKRVMESNNTKDVYHGWLRVFYKGGCNAGKQGNVTRAYRYDSMHRRVRGPMFDRREHTFGRGEEREGSKKGGQEQRAASNKHGARRA